MKGRFALSVELPKNATVRDVCNQLNSGDSTIDPIINSEIGTAEAIQLAKSIRECKGNVSSLAFESVQLFDEQGLILLKAILAKPSITYVSLRGNALSNACAELIVDFLEKHQERQLKVDLSENVDILQNNTIKSNLIAKLLRIPSKIPSNEDDKPNTEDDKQISKKRKLSASSESSSTLFNKNTDSKEASTDLIRVMKMCKELFAEADKLTLDEKNQAFETITQLLNAGKKNTPHS